MIERTENKRKWQLEWLWWGVTLVAVVLVLLPIWSRVPNYPFYARNALFVVACIQYARLCFALRYTPFSRSPVFKLIVVFTTLPILLLLTDSLSMFQNYLDEVGIEPLLTHLSIGDQRAMAKYIRTEMIFFGVGSIVAVAFACIRMIISIWRVRNTPNRV